MPNPADALYPAGPSMALGNDVVGEDNLLAVDKEIKLTKQEKALYKRHLINLTGAGGVDNEDGSRSTLFATTVGIEDKTYTIPTVWDGKILDPKDALEKAKKFGLDNFPSYDSHEEASKRYNKLHDYMEKDTKKYLSSRGK